MDRPSDCHLRDPSDSVDGNVSCHSRGLADKQVLTTSMHITITNDNNTKALLTEQTVERPGIAEKTFWVA